MADKISKKKYYLLKFLEGFLMVLPLLILVAVRHEKYIYSTGSAISVSIGGVLIIILVACSILGALHLKGLGWSIALFVTCWFLKTLLDDVLLILLCFAIGQVMATILRFMAGNEKERVSMERNAAATAKQTERIVKKYIGNGRV